MRLHDEFVCWAAATEGAAGAAEATQEGGEAPPAAGAGKTSDAAQASPDATEQQAADWREGIEDQKLRDLAGRFASPSDLVKSVRDLQSERDRLKNSAIVPPGEDAGEDEIKAFREKMGVPDGPDGYDFLKPAEGEELSDFEQQSREAWMQRFHEIGVPKDQAQKIVEAWRGDMAESQKAVEQADEQFARDSEKVLKQEWGEDFDRNKRIASSAASELFGDDLDDMKQAQTRDGRLLMDHPAMLRMLARVGREMQEGSMGAMTDDQRNTLEEQANEARAKRNEAMARGDRETARKWDEKEREILAKVGGSGPIVGAEGRAA